MSLLTVSVLLGIGCFAIFGALQLWLSWFPNLHDVLQIVEKPWGR